MTQHSQTNKLNYVIIGVPAFNPKSFLPKRSKKKNKTNLIAQQHNLKQKSQAIFLLMLPDLFILPDAKKDAYTYFVNVLEF